MTGATAGLEREYREAAQAYLEGLPLEHFMESTAQATQRRITLASFDLIRARRPDVQCFNELLLQYPQPKTRRLGQVVPDNMVVVHPEPLRADGSYDLPLQPAGPLVVLEYVSERSQRKDYEGNIYKYERAVRVPYYLLFYPDAQELTLFRLRGRSYRAAPPDPAGRVAVAELELEVGLADGWMRYWFRGELLPLPAELLSRLDAARGLLESERVARRAAEWRADAERAARQALEEEVARLRAELAAKG